MRIGVVPSDFDQDIATYGAKTTFVKCQKSFNRLRSCYSLETYLIEYFGASDNYTLVYKESFFPSNWTNLDNSTMAEALINGKFKFENFSIIYEHV